ncbi:GNAT family N-acetyltransferase [Stappia sp. F7233]|uniref:GNAT family N-acetyltransferase n=1 Tax=Stappia albiluteola TaxID=2758565 RepID=A0A839AI07_9HYPH|nr:GNAT family N-acetyltransferase [Stappia albiluteola]
MTFTRLPEISPDEIIAHMNDPRVTEHMPLATFVWDEAFCGKFVGMKEDCWQRDGLGHWAILGDGAYIGWGGFQKEGEEWDFGLVLKAECFGLGARIARKALDFARSDERIPFVTFLLPPSRKHLKGLDRLGARLVGEVDHSGSTFLKFRLDTK